MGGESRRGGGEASSKIERDKKCGWGVKTWGWGGK